MGTNTRLLFLLLSVGGLSRLAEAQATGTIHGTVYDNSGAVVAGAQISAINAQTNQPRAIAPATAANPQA